MTLKPSSGLFLSESLDETIIENSRFSAICHSPNSLKLLPQENSLTYQLWDKNAHFLDMKNGNILDLEMYSYNFQNF